MNEKSAPAAQEGEYKTFKEKVQLIFRLRSLRNIFFSSTSNASRPPAVRCDSHSESVPEMRVLGIGGVELSD